MEIRVRNLYDSHVHFLGTAEYLAGWQLDELAKPDDFLAMRIPESARRGAFRIGFGWDPQKINAHFLNKETLDYYFPNFPVMLSRKDGHASWLNTLALQALGFENSTGVLDEGEHFLALERLPAFSKEELKNKLLEAANIFLKQGFTHLRDLTSTVEEAWALNELAEEGRFVQWIELNFLVKKMEDLEVRLAELSRLKSQLVPSILPRGIKIFYDGTLGAGNAFLSSCPCCRDSQYWSKELFKDVLVKTWGQGFEISVHCIGDQAVDDIVTWTREVSAAGNVGHLNIEHGELIRPETIQKMKPLHMRVHMQPCHWTDDCKWFARPENVKLLKWAFPWESLAKAKIPLSFGSDSPVVAPSLFHNLTALADSAKHGIRAFTADPLKTHSYPHFQEAVVGESVFVEGELKSVSINGRTYFERN